MTVPMLTGGPEQRERLRVARERVSDAREVGARAKREFMAAKEIGDKTAADAALSAMEAAAAEVDVARALESRLLGQMMLPRRDRGACARPAPCAVPAGAGRAAEPKDAQPRVPRRVLRA